MQPTLSTWSDLLGGYHMPFTPRAALDYLTRQIADIGILGCYQMFFAEQWAATVTPLFPDRDHAYSQREWEMFRLTHQHLFPLDLDYLDDLDGDPDNRSLTLPISPMGIEWWETGADYYRPGVQILLVLSGAVPVSYTSLPSPLSAELYRIGAGQGQPFWFPATQTVPAVMNALYPAYARIHHDTGNAWLDASDENPIDMEWNVPDLEFCTAQYRAAQALLDQIAPLIAWLEDNPRPLLEVLAACSPLPMT